MTRIAERKTVMRGETNTIYSRRPLCVELKAHDVVIWRKGTRDKFRVPYEAIYQAGAKIELLEERRLKSEKKWRESNEAAVRRKGNQ